MKRWVPVVLVATLLLASLPVGVHAQTGIGEVTILTDSDSDVEVRSVGQDVPPANSRFAPSDVSGLFIEETPESLVFRIQARDVAHSDEILFLEQGEILVEFLLGPQDRYLLDLQHADSNAWAYLYHYDAAAERYIQTNWCGTCNNAVTVDPSVASWLITVPRDQLLDVQGASIHPGLSLHDFVVRSYGVFNGAGGLFEVEDTMPDDGEPRGELVPRLGVKQTGHLHLASAAPVRASNGEATTYVFDITLKSSRNGTDDVRLQTVSVPANWNVRLPAESVRMDNATLLHLPVLASVPFGHEHGSFESFVVEAHSAKDPSAVGRVELGVRFTEIPQMAGHHSRLWLHSVQEPANQLQDGFNTVGFGGRDTSVHFNAAEGTDDPRDQEVNVDPYNRNYPLICQDQEVPTCIRYGWRVPLEPALQIGLDFDLNGSGRMELPIYATFPLQDAFVEGTLWYQRSSEAARNDGDTDLPRGEPILLGTFAPSLRQGSNANQAITFSTEFTPTPESDFLLYEPFGATVWMNVELITTAPSTIFADQNLQPQLAPGGFMDLPLKEYHDPVDDLYVSLTDVEVVMESDQEQYVNSGETILFELRIENTGVVNDRFAVSMSGHNGDWAKLLGDSSFSVKSHESRRIVVAVAAPLDSNQGDTVDVVLEAVSLSDPNARALVRLFAEVDNLVDHEDKSHLVPVTQEELTYTPIGPWLAPLGLLGATLLLRRRT